ncbi:phytoene desaturase family protein [Plantibacter sp. Mn2098]|uniref:phytoene desaturase family protein n=1 Tax=Plantibacter sp. Mn2098 TaxID=3395266 RepID=UPI003BC939FF
MTRAQVDAIIVGSGPNGLAAGVVLARAGLEVVLYEANPDIGGGARTSEATLPGFRHDWGAAVHPMAFASPFFRDFQLTDRVEFSVPDASYAHPVVGAASGIAWHDLDRTVDALGADGAAWRRLFGPLAQHIDRYIQLAMSPMQQGVRTPLTTASYGVRVLAHSTPLGALAFRDRIAPAMLAGVLAHSIGPIPSFGTAAPGLMLGALAHTAGWPIPRHGTQSITDALASDFRANGGTIVTGARITDLAELPPARAVLFDTDPGQLLRIAGRRLAPGYVRALNRFRHGNAASKVDFALSGPIPWADPDIRSAGTVHVGGTRAEISAAEQEVAAGRHAEAPYVLLSQPSIVDPTRAPGSAHSVWTYAHVPAGSDLDMTEAVTAQIERFAPGFRDLVLASHATPATAIERGNANFVGGDIAGGAVDLRQLVARPRLGADPWRAGTGLYLCSASATPGPGVHGMGGYHAARTALRDVFGAAVPELGRSSS